MFWEDTKKILYPFVSTMLIYGSVFVIIKNIFLLIGDVSLMEPWLSNILAGIAAAIVGGVITLIVNYKNQINKNTEAIEKLTERIGVDKDKTLKVHIDEIRSDIGRNDGGSLSKQHSDMQKNISETLDKDFGEIKERYEKEDDEYHKFTNEQRDINQAMKNFVTDYRKVVGDASGYREEIYELKKQIEAQEKLIAEKDKTIEDLNNTILQKEQIKEKEQDAAIEDDLNPIDEDIDV